MLTSSSSRTEQDGPWRPTEFTVNHPLRLPQANVHLLGHGYAPILRYTEFETGLPRSV